MEKRGRFFILYVVSIIFTLCLVFFVDYRRSIRNQEEITAMLIKQSLEDVSLAKFGENKDTVFSEKSKENFRKKIETASRQSRQDILGSLYIVLLVIFLIGNHAVLHKEDASDIIDKIPRSNVKKK